MLITIAPRISNQFAGAFNRPQAGASAPAGFSTLLSFDMLLAHEEYAELA